MPAVEQWREQAEEQIESHRVVEVGEGEGVRKGPEIGRKLGAPFD